MIEKVKTVKCSKVIEEENILLKKRRELLLGKQEAEKLPLNRFGIALSGGGIRSATINLGFLKTMNRCGILQKADYLSTVSGGGYTGGYIQTSLKNGVPYKDLFQEEHIKHMKERGSYMVPGTGFRKMWNQFLLVIGFLFSLLMSWLSPLVIIALVYGLYMFLDALIVFVPTAPQLRQDFFTELFKYGGISLLGVILIHYLLNVIKSFNLDISLGLHKVEAVAVMIGLLCFLFAFFLGFEGFSGGVFQMETFSLYLMMAILLGILGMFTNPNATSFHRFYRQRLADAFLGFAGNYKNVLLKNLFQIDDPTEKRHYNAPYPLVNSCLNLQASHDENFQGTKASDYFLLSPLYCGAKLTDYVSTKDTYMYNKMTFPAAITVSAAAVNPGMGIYSNKILSILTTVLNLRLGYWMPNPLKLKVTHPLVWWPMYFFYELLSKIGTDNKMLNISDGGHIENLAVYELLRRRCRLIIAVDAGEDANFAFIDLENLTIRARNELGLDIRFRKGNIPEDTIRPKPSHGYSEKRFAIADIYQLWDKVEEDGVEKIKYYKDKKVGTFVYVKSSVTAPEGRPKITQEKGEDHNTYYYKIFHPNFPHEPTSDQFFDKVQWESYYRLGEFLGADVLDLKNYATYEDKDCPQYTIDSLINKFNPASRIMPEMAPLAPKLRSRGVGLQVRSLKLDKEEAIKEVPKEVHYKM